MKTDNIGAVKKAVLECGLVAEVSHAKREIWRTQNPSELRALKGTYGLEVVEVALSLLDSWRCRKLRCFRKIGKCVISGNAYFITLTFTDDVLAKTSDKTRRRYVSRFLKGISETYAANIDFGGANGREHYHAVAVREEFNETMKRMWSDKYGFIYVEKIGSSESDLKSVCKYVAKLSNHALKASTGQFKRLIYSRHSFVPSVADLASSPF